MRLSLLIVPLAVGLLSPVQTPPAIQAWEKPVAPGLVYRMEVDESTPRIVHALRYSPGSPAVRAVAELGRPTIFDRTRRDSRSTTTEIRGSALAAVNADFFPISDKDPLRRGDPLGLMVRDGALLSTPWPDRALAAWGPRDVAFGVAKFEGKLETEAGVVALSGVNQPAKPDETVLVTPEGGVALGPTPNLVLRLRLPRAKVAPTTVLTATVGERLVDREQTPVGADEVVVVAQGEAAKRLAAVGEGSQVTLRLRTEGFDWAKHDQAVGGGPLLLQNGRIAAPAGEGFNRAFRETRHPRTAMGRTVDGDIWFVVIDGRQKMSVGASLEETARILLRLGCTDAVNLDGGGSSAMNVLGVVLNRPSDGRERMVANGIALVGPRPGGPLGRLSLTAPKELKVGETAVVEVRMDGRTIAPAQVLYGAQGAAWIDQGGLLRAFQPGEATVRVGVYGQTLEVKVTVQGT